MIEPLFLATHATTMKHALSVMLDRHSAVVPEPLFSAMRYALMAGGKRIRPTLLLECYRACGGNDETQIIPAAMAVECAHTYSLIHDDLPCMDDDDWRRGMPACHKRFNEATAVLAGDALQSLAFELFTEIITVTEHGIELIKKFSIAIGCQGMVAGQILDMQADHHGVKKLLEVERIHIHKTGTLIRFCCETGALLANAPEKQRNACAHYGAAVGLLFQITDDILDATSSMEEMGKSAGKDAAQNKATYVSLLGLNEAKNMAVNLCETAKDAAESLGSSGDALSDLATYILERRA